MTKQLREYETKFNAFSLRERALVVITLLVVIIYLWWMFFAGPQLEEYRSVQQQNITLATEIESLQIASDQIDQRLREGVHLSKQKKLELLRSELQRVNQMLKQKTLELIQPDDMFALMRDMIFRDSKLTLTALKRKSVQPAFETAESTQEEADIYRHVMTIGFQGRYRDILSYIERLEGSRWKLIWDRISLATGDYPQIDVEIEISTLSDSDRWVGL